ncbi:MAG: NFACT family protein [archaeon]
MIVSNYFLHFLSRELKPVIENSFINKVQLIDKHLLKFKLNTRKGTKDLIIGKEVIYITDYSMQAVESRHSFIESLRKHLFNKVIKEFKVKENERIAYVETDNCFLIFELFSKSNIILTDKNWEIISCYFNEKWKDRTIRKGFTYQFPLKKVNPFELKEKEFKLKLKESKNDLIRFLVRDLQLSPLIAENITFSLKLDKKAKLNELKKKDFENVFEKIKWFYSKEIEKNLQPTVVKINDELVFLPVKLESLKEKEVVLEKSKLNELLDETITKEIMFKQENLEKEGFNKKIGKVEHNLKEQLEAKEKFENQIKDNQLKAKLLYFNYSKVKAMMEAVKKGREKKLSEKEIMSKIQSVENWLVGLNLKEKKIVVELNE